MLQMLWSALSQCSVVLLKGPHKKTGTMSFI
jgi:hypothetical protein